MNGEEPRARAGAPLALPTATEVAALPIEQLPGVLAQLGGLVTVAGARLATNMATMMVTTDGVGLLDIDETAQLLKVSPRWLYKHHKTLPFTRRVGRCLKFDRAGVAKFCARRPPESR